MFLTRMEIWNFQGKVIAGLGIIETFNTNKLY